MRRALAVAAAAALLPLGRIALDTVDPAGASVAMGADGALQCSGEGHAAPIAPRDADLRLLPRDLPEGWEVAMIAARWGTSKDQTACRVPALSLVQVDGDRVVTGTLSVYGLFPKVDVESFTGKRATVPVAGEQGLLLDSSQQGFQRWVWTAGDDGTWVMEAHELTPKEGELVAAGISTTGTDADWQPADEDADLQVVSQRSGPLPTYEVAQLAWYVNLTGPAGQAAHYTVDYQPEHPTAALAAARPAAVVSLDGTEARMEQRDPDEGEDRIMVWREGLRISAGPGLVFETPDTDTDPDAPATVPFGVLSAVVDSLAPVPGDDPRLTELALDEDTVKHP